MDEKQIFNRLRDCDSGSKNVEGRVGGALRWLGSTPSVLDSEAHARIRAVLRAKATPPSSPGQLRQLGRLVVQVGGVSAVCLVVGGAAAALRPYWQSEPPAKDISVPASTSAPVTSATCQPPAPSFVSPQPEVQEKSIQGQTEDKVKIAGIAPAPLREVPGQLAIDPSSESYRVKVPLDLAQPGAAFSALIHLCVSQQGHVTSLTLLGGAHPRLDPLILAKVKTWKYRPALSHGRAIPFCRDVRYLLMVDSD